MGQRVGGAAGAGLTGDRNQNILVVGTVFLAFFANHGGFGGWWGAVGRRGVFGDFYFSVKKMDVFHSPEVSRVRHCVVRELLHFGSFLNDLRRFQQLSVLNEHHYHYYH